MNESNNISLKCSLVAIALALGGCGSLFKKTQNTVPTLPAATPQPPQLTQDKKNEGKEPELKPADTTVFARKQ